LKIAFSPAKEESKERKSAMDAARKGTLWKNVQTSLNPRQRRRQEKLKVKTSPQSRIGMIHQVKMKSNCNTLGVMVIKTGHVIICIANHSCFSQP
jgi:hypothetical protein